MAVTQLQMWNACVRSFTTNDSCSWIASMHFGIHRNRIDQATESFKTHKSTDRRRRQRRHRRKEKSRKSECSKIKFAIWAQRSRRRRRWEESRNGKTMKINPKWFHYVKTHACALIVRRIKIPLAKRINAIGQNARNVAATTINCQFILDKNEMEMMENDNAKDNSEMNVIWFLSSA